MSGLQLFYIRLKQDYRSQWKIVRSIFDWTIIIYLAVPALVFLAIFYRSWWQQAPEWLATFPTISFAMLCYILAWQGNCRTYMEEADQLYLLQHKVKIVNMRTMAMVYSVSLTFLKWIALFILFLPITRHFPEWNAGNFTSVFLYFLSLNIALLSCKQVFNQYRFWKKWSFATVTFICLSILTFIVVHQLTVTFFLVLSIIFLGFSVRQLTSYQRQFKTFYKDVDDEKKRKVLLTSFVFSINPEIHMHKQKPKKRSVLLWRNSKRIFKKRTAANGVTELFIKAFFRDSSLIYNYLQMLSLTTVLIVLTPIWMKWLFFIGFYFFFNEWLKLTFQDLIKQNPYLLIDREKKQYLLQAQIKSQRIIGAPGIVYMLIITSLATWLSSIF
ncbi:ABC transporter permease [Metabacillus malikii]|uniref:ABC-type exoprotein transport system permease subunit n=1 Tax=Metabacillus malikii TaxID=1504265 RepID=A0ABT9ZGW3_9BACI|nr:ABC transporter permease [Metabacillus malikii]MDQ0231210.1 putative ABC-type exoprotein transport system permease subunit [Metabacillus malikii]